MRTKTIIDMMTLSIVIITIWHVTVFIACVKLPTSFFDPNKSRYLPKSWEHGGKWYRDHLKIQLWKDRVPQHIGKDGFSKTHLTDVSIDYLDEFIMETCRGEWMHLNNCICAAIILVIDFPMPGLLLGFLVLLANLPFACIQRYNRFRLQILRKKLLRDLRAAEANGPVTA